MGKKTKDMALRTLSGILLLIVVLGSVLLSEYTFLALMIIICTGVMWEFFELAGRNVKTEPQRYYAIAVAVIIIAVCFLVARGTFDYHYIAAIIPPIMLIFALELFRERTTPLLNICVSLGGLAYAALPIVLMCFMVFAAGEYNPYIVLGCIFIVWMNDIFAYLTGVSFGRHKMFERISPKKSWEGFFGGLVFAVAFAVLCGYLLGENLIVWAGLGALIAVCSVLGDFIESMLKREAGVKDSGNILPGHGGFMDRFDAFVYSIPFAFVYFYTFMF